MDWRLLPRCVGLADVYIVPVRRPVQACLQEISGTATKARSSFFRPHDARSIWATSPVGWRVDPLAPVLLYTYSFVFVIFQFLPLPPITLQYDYEQQAAYAPYCQPPFTLLHAELMILYTQTQC